MDVDIRKATINDLVRVQELNLKLFEKEYEEWDSLLDLNWTFSEVGTKYFADRISVDEGFVFVALVNNEIVGYLCGGLTKAEEYRKLPVVAELENTFVLEKFRSSGIGGKMYAKFIEWCKAKNVGKVRVEATAQNELAINFYRNNGFRDYTLVLESDL
ncbi:MAG: GNAT family N-acetyltransferase [Nanoarchaeota archaeon]|jgi:ribosomal protein S18 acetylase RimI-like enzyme|nr:GNAT family N-acetyltransferase [Nanoarchaeota archaeon]